MIDTAQAEILAAATAPGVYEKGGGYGQKGVDFQRYWAAIVAAIGNRAAFRKGREFATWLGIVPRQHSTGGKAKLLGISKRGNVYLRKILIHGARAAVLRIKRDRAPIGAWLDALDSRAPKNVVVVAMANKLARIAWAVLSSGEDYRPLPNGSAA